MLPFNVSVVFTEIRGTDPLTTNRFVLYPCPQDNDFLSLAIWWISMVEHWIYNLHIPNNKEVGDSHIFMGYLYFFCKMPVCPCLLSCYLFDV